MIEKIAEALYNARYLDAGDGGRRALKELGGLFDYRGLIHRADEYGRARRTLAELRKEAALVAETLHPILHDAVRWQQLMASGRMRVQGSAGFNWLPQNTIVPNGPDEPLHMGVEFWDVRGTTEFLKDAPAQRHQLETLIDREHAQAISCLTNFVDELIRRKA